MTKRRPPVSAKKPALKTVTVPIRATPEERDRMRKAAKLDGLGLSPWLRQLGLQAATQRLGG